MKRMRKQASEDIEPSQQSSKNDCHKDVSFNVPEKAQNTRVLSCIIVGGGMRGQCYSSYAKDFPHLVRYMTIVLFFGG